jgi:Zn-dependent alcohol dehydrogenase
MKALVLNAIGRGFDFEDVDIAAPFGREVLIEVRASGLCHTDLLFATHHDFVPMYAALYLQGRMNLDDLVSKKISLSEVNDGYEALKDGSLTRVVVTSF